MEHHPVHFYSGRFEDSKIRSRALRVEETRTGVPFLFIFVGAIIIHYTVSYQT